MERRNFELSADCSILNFQKCTHSGTVLLQLTREWVGLQKEFIGYKVWVAFLSTALVRGEKKVFAPINIESHATDVHINVLYKAIVKTARSK